MTSTRTSFELTSAQQWYLDTFMNKVSRSFAVVVACLEAPLNHVMATAYLLCRVVDNQAAQAMVADNSAIYRYHQQIKYEVEAAFTTPVGQGAMYNPGLLPSSKREFGTA